jgi:hypothetical protein
MPFPIVFLHSTDVVVISTIALLSTLARVLNPWDTKIKDIVQGLENRQRALEGEMTYEDRRLTHTDRVGCQLQGFLTALPFENHRSKYDGFITMVSPDSHGTNWLVQREEFINWAYNSRNGILCIYGKRE